MSEKKISDIMIPIDTYLAISADDGFKEAVSALKKSYCPSEGEICSGHTTILVYDNNMLVGMIGLEELLKAIEPQYLKGNTYRGWTVSSEWSIPVFWEGLFNERTQDAMDKKARDIMSPIDFLVEGEDPLIKAVYGMGKNKVNILPVTEDGRVVGMVRSTELFQEICNLILEDGAQVYSLNRLTESAKKAGWISNAASRN